MRKAEIDDKFHATSDRQWVRDEVFNLLGRHEFQVDATILEKSKAQPQTRTSDATFYQYAWYYHAKHYLPKNFRHGDTALISAAALETKSGKAAFKNAFNNAIQQTGGHLEIVTAFPLSAHDPCLQAADYCAWALQRKWEYGDDRSYKLIEGKINSEYDLWKWGSIEFY
jgi:hypothetical protein